MGQFRSIIIIKQRTCQSLHDCGPPYDVVPTDRTGLDILPAVLTDQVAGHTLVDPHSSHLLQTHRTLQQVPHSGLV